MTVKIPEPKGFNPVDMPWARAVTDYIREQQGNTGYVNKTLGNLLAGQAGIFTAVEETNNQIAEVGELTGVSQDVSVGIPTAPTLASSQSMITATWDGLYAAQDPAPLVTPVPERIGSIITEASLTLPPPFDPEVGGEPVDPFVAVGTPFRTGSTVFAASDIGAAVGDTVYVRFRSVKAGTTDEGFTSAVSSVVVTGVALTDLNQAVNDFLDEINGKADAAVVSAVDEYAVSTSSSVAPTSGWSTAIPSWSTTNYIWRRTRTEKADGSFSTGTPAVLTGNPGTPGTPGTPGAPATTVLLSNESHTFAGSTTAAIAGSTTSSVMAYVGTTAANATVGTITGQVTGLTTSIASNGTTAPVITITVTTALTALSGVLTVPVTVNGQTFTKNIAWAVARTGTSGAPGTPGAPGAVISLTATTQVLSVPATGGATTPATAVVTGTAVNTTITVWQYSVNGAAFSATLPAGTTRSGNVVTITGSTMTARTIAVRMADAAGNADTLTVAKVSDGAAGTPGADGAPGPVTYTWLKYADSPTTGMSDLPTGKAYMGLAYNKLTPTESSSYGDYAWSLIKGADGSQGIQGPPGDNGQPTYTWVKYGTSATGAGMSDDPAGKTYIGLAYNKLTQTESTVASDYQWALIKGADGADGSQGIPGTPGTGISTYTRFYYLTAGAEPAKPTVLSPPAPWSTTEPNYTPGSTDKLYYTDRTVLTSGAFSYSNVSLSTSFEAAKAAYTRSTLAIDTANGKNKTIFSTSPASGTVGYVAGDIWFQKNGTLIIGQWEFTTSWQQRTLDNAVIANLDAGKITTGFLDVVNRIKAGSIVVSKMAIGDFQNLIPNADFANDAAGWTSAYPQWTTFSNGTATLAPAASAGIWLGYEGNLSTGPRATADGPLYVSYEARLVSGTPTTGTLGVFSYQWNAAGGNVTNGWAGGGTSATSLTTAWQKFDGVFTPHATAATVRLMPYIYLVTAGTVIEYRNPTVRRMTKGELIVDGAITAVKVTMDEAFANKFWANEANFGKVSAQMIQGDAIDGKTITGATVRSAATGARTELNNQGLRVLNASNQELIRLGYGITTGMEVRNPSTGLLVPLADAAFGAVSAVQTDVLAFVAPASTTPASSGGPGTFNAWTRHSADGLTLAFTAVAPTYLLQFGQVWAMNMYAGASLQIFVAPTVNGVRLTASNGPYSVRTDNINGSSSNAELRVSSATGSLPITTVIGSNYTIQLQFRTLGWHTSSIGSSLANRFITATPVF